jgi:predicted nuclease of predicted toxin-antitoxin system
VRFLVDAQLPQKLAVALTNAGHDAIHTLDLPDKNRTSDSLLQKIADAQGRIVVSKDADFLSSHLVSGTPQRLLEISTGNMANAQLLSLILGNLVRIEAAFVTTSHVELTATTLIVHG